MMKRIDHAGPFVLLRGPRRGGELQNLWIDERRECQRAEALRSTAKKHTASLALEKELAEVSVRIHNQAWSNATKRVPLPQAKGIQPPQVGVSGSSAILQLTKPFGTAIFLGVKFVKIKFESSEEEAKAFHGLIQRGRVISLRDDEFIVAAAALDWLRSQNFTPTILAWLNQDDVLQTVRNSAAHPV
jgi:hypothetical protein